MTSLAGNTQSVLVSGEYIGKVHVLGKDRESPDALTAYTDSGECTKRNYRRKVRECYCDEI